MGRTSRGRTRASTSSADRPYLHARPVADGPCVVREASLLAADRSLSHCTRALSFLIDPAVGARLNLLVDRTLSRSSVLGNAHRFTHHRYYVLVCLRPCLGAFMIEPSGFVIPCQLRNRPGAFLVSIGCAVILKQSKFAVCSWIYPHGHNCLRPAAATDLRTPRHNASRSHKQRVDYHNKWVLASRALADVDSARYW